MADSRHILTVELAWVPDGLRMGKIEKRMTMFFWPHHLEYGAGIIKRGEAEMKLGFGGKGSGIWFWTCCV